jgi:hypothetical protein
MRRSFPIRDRSLRAAATFSVPLALVVVIAGLVLPDLTRHRLPRTAPLGQTWVATAKTVGSIAADDPTVARLFFGGPNSYVLTGGWAAARASMAWASERMFARDLAAGTIPPNVTVAMYDPEGWPQTPLEERQHPAAAMQAFAELARRAGYTVVITPYVSLVDVDGADCVRARGETLAQAFLRCGFLRRAAQLADVVEIQAQYLEAEPAECRLMVLRAAAQARAANPDVVVVAGLSTRYALDGQSLLDAWDAVSDIVDGHYMAVPDGFRPDIAASFLRALADRAS